MHSIDLRLKARHQPLARRFFSSEISDEPNRAQNFLESRDRNQSDLESQPLHLPCLVRIGRSRDADHKIRFLGDDGFYVGIDEIADLSDPLSLRRIVAESRHAHQTIAQTESKKDFSRTGRERDNLFGNRRRTGRSRTLLGHTFRANQA